MLAVEKEIIINSERVFVALFIQHAMCMRHIILSRNLSGCSVFLHIGSRKAHFSKIKILLKIKCVFDFLDTF
jgi:hypothetical protein